MNDCTSQIAFITIVVNAKWNKRIEWGNALLRESQYHDNRDCHEHIEWDVHKVPFWYIFARVKRPTQRAYFRGTFRKGNEKPGWYMLEPYSWKSGTLGFPSHNWEIFERPDPWQTSFFIPATSDKCTRAFWRHRGIKKKRVKDAENERYTIIPPEGYPVLAGRNDCVY